MFLYQWNVDGGQWGKSGFSPCALGVCPGPLAAKIHLAEGGTMGSVGETGLYESHVQEEKDMNPSWPKISKVPHPVKECDLPETKQLHQFPIIPAAAQGFAWFCKAGFID